MSPEFRNNLRPKTVTVFKTAIAPARVAETKKSGSFYPKRISNRITTKVVEV